MAWTVNGFVAASMLSLVTTGLLTGQASSGVITGDVVDGDSSPIRGAALVLGGSQQGTLSDEAGRFVIRDVPVGRTVIRAIVLGHYPDVAFVVVPPDAVVEVNLQVGRTAIPISGAELSYPDYVDREAATALLPQVVHGAAANTWIKRHLSEASLEDPIVMWAPWMTEPEVVVSVGESLMRVTRECSECGVDFEHTLEGGRVHTVATRHFTVILRKLRTGTRQFEFSLDLAQPGERRLVHGPSRGQLRVLLVQTVDGQWVPLEHDG